MSTSTSSEAWVDFKVKAMKIALKLSYLEHFPEAAKELLKYRTLSSSEFKRHSRKIVALIEIARATLTKAGMHPYRFNICTPTYLPHKMLYLDLLEFLVDHQGNIDAAVQARVRRLLLPLSASGFVVQKQQTPFPVEHPVYVSHGLRHPKDSSVGTSHPFLSLTPTPEQSSVMLPPDAFHWKTHRTGYLSKSLYAAMRIKPKPFCRPVHEGLGQEEGDPDPETKILLRPLPRRFGIFCTGKTSMHRTAERSGRTRSSRRAIS
ncbi:hypothetical protein BD779DRAFT_1521898 [Infundibulicybe gibba]|nr:hypothetical protein BD779DRAFT_1521898 [Infundibulicybe gibba]